MVIGKARKLFYYSLVSICIATSVAEQENCGRDCGDVGRRSSFGLHLSDGPAKNEIAHSVSMRYHQKLSCLRRDSSIGQKRPAAREGRRREMRGRSSVG